jgi:hypothetical protein
VWYLSFRKHKSLDHAQDTALLVVVGLVETNTDGSNEREINIRSNGDKVLRQLALVINYPTYGLCSSKDLASIEAFPANFCDWAVV